MQETKKNWYADWFNTPFYPILYKDRDYQEAQLFIDNMTQYLNLAEGSKVLDLACGRGRHSVYLNRLGYEVLGVDLSESSIQAAKRHENELLKFEVKDMRMPMGEKFDAVFNLFTSFGYFPNDDDHLKTLQFIHDSLNDYGLEVLDFMNAKKLIKHLIPEEHKIVDGIDFHIKRWVEKGAILKNIQFEHDGAAYDFTERVRAFSKEDFEEMMDQLGIYMLDTFGNYRLQKFDVEESDRLIMVFK